MSEVELKGLFNPPRGDLWEANDIPFGGRYHISTLPYIIIKNSTHSIEVIVLVSYGTPTENNSDSFKWCTIEASRISGNLQFNFYECI